MEGIYYYTDLMKNNEVVYVGKDSNIHKNKRHKDHLKPSNYNNQPFNRVLQNNPNRFKYHVLKKGEFSQNLLNALEILYIRRYSPRFNYTIGGEGAKGLKISEEARKRMSENHADVSGKNNPFYGKTHSEEVRKIISEANIGENNHHYGKHFSKEHRLNLSKCQNTSGYFRVNKQRDDECKQGFKWRYQYYDENHKKIAITSVDIKKLEKKVKEKGLEWIVLSNNNEEN